MGTPWNFTATTAMLEYRMKNARMVARPGVVATVRPSTPTAAAAAASSGLDRAINPSTSAPVGMATASAGVSHGRGTWGSNSRGRTLIRVAPR